MQFLGFYFLDYRITGCQSRETNYSESFMMIKKIKALVNRFLKFHHEILSPEGASVSP
jgi:hypothetical protein